MFILATQSLPILCTSNHLSQLVLAGEVRFQVVEVSNEVAGRGKHSFLGGDFAVGLNSEFELGKERMRDLGPVINMG
jgi:hypothetical protein